MITDRIRRVNSTLQKIIGEAIEKEIEIPPNVLVTVSEVKTSNDLSFCKVYLSVLPVNKEEYMVDKISKATRLVNEYIFKKIALKKYPKLIFQIDENPQEVNKIEKLLEKVKEDSED